MKRFAMLALAATAAVPFAVAADSSAAAAATGDPAIGIQVLDLLCAARGGTAFKTPYTITRCQEARPRRGFVIEELVCEGLLGGEFASAPSFNRPNRTTWVCRPVAAS